MARRSEGLPLFLEHVLQSLVVQAEVHDHLFEAAILVFEFAQALGVKGHDI